MADFFGIPVSEINVWLIWILPFAAAMIIPAVGKFSKLSTGRVAVAFALMSAISAATLPVDNFENLPTAGIIIAAANGSIQINQTFISLTGIPKKSYAIV